MIYKATKVITTRYLYEIEAENRDEALDKLSEMAEEDATGHQVLDIADRLDDYGDTIDEEVPKTAPEATE